MNINRFLQILEDYVINAHAKFTIIEEVCNKSVLKLKIHSLLFLDFEISNSFPARSKHIT